MLNLYKSGHLEIPCWYGWFNRHTCLINWWSTTPRNIGQFEFTHREICILPLHFWAHIYIFRAFSGSRICVGLGLVSFFFDFERKTNSKANI